MNAPTLVVPIILIVAKSLMHSSSAEGEISNFSSSGRLTGNSEIPLGGLRSDLAATWKSDLSRKKLGL